jgi:hypothetical protein
MKRTLPFLVVLILVQAVLSSCRKGENDPWLSFRPRDARITQKWEIKGLDGTFVTAENGASSSFRYELNQNIITIVQSPGSARNFGYSFTIQLFDNGNMQAIETLTDSVGTQFESLANGQWYWLDDAKNKGSIKMDLAGVLAPIEAFQIDRLAYDELVLNAQASVDNSIPGEGESLVSWDFDIRLEPAPE